MKTIKYLPFYLVSLLPLAILYIFSEIVYFLAFYIIKYRKEVVLNNLKSSFPEKSEIEITAIAKKFYKNLSDMIFEVLKSYSFSKKSIFNRYKILNNDLLEDYYQQDRNVIILSGHVFNWEWFSLLPNYTNYHCAAMYQRQSNTYYNDLAIAIRAHFGVNCVESRSGFRELKKLNQDGKRFISIMIGDQSPPNIKPKTVWCDFLNRNTAFLNGSERIAEKLDCVVLYPHFQKTKRGFYTVEFKIINDNVNRSNVSGIIQKFATLLEENITESPDLWLWSHNRWKHQEPDLTNTLVKD